MGRPLKMEYPGAVYHVTRRGNERRDIFLEVADRRKFLCILEDYHDRSGILIYCYVLMDNHYHLVLETPRGNLIKRYAGLSNQEIGTLFGGMHYSAATKASARLETEMTRDKGLRNHVKEILSIGKARHRYIYNSWRSRLGLCF
jgi:REP element-mobilizing transposase RayT